MNAIKTSSKGINLKPASGYNYFIEWCRINSVPKILEWVRHLLEKDWCTTELIQELIDAAADHHGINVWVNA